MASLLEAALGDLSDIEQDGRYIIDFHSWHDPKPDGRVGVCLAGAFAVKRLGAEYGKELCETDFAEKRALECLDLLSRATVGRAATRFRDWRRPVKYDVRPAMELQLPFFAVKEWQVPSAEALAILKGAGV